MHAIDATSGSDLSGPTPNAQRLLWAGFTAILAAGVGFAIRGGIIDIFSPYGSHPVRIDLWADEVETIRRFDPQSQRTFEDVTEIYVFPVREEILTDPDMKAQVASRNSPSAVVT